MNPKYRFNSDDINFDKVSENWGKKIWKGLIYVSAILVLAILLNLIYSIFFDTPRERQVKRENELLMEQYAILNQRKQAIDTVLTGVRETDKDIYRVIFETEPIERDSLYGLMDPYLLLMNKTDEQIVYETAVRLDSILTRAGMNSLQYDFIQVTGENKRGKLPFIPAIQPIENRDLSRTASGFGYRMHPIYEIRKMHSGMDFTAPIGTPVFATADGVVETAARSGRGLGNRIIIDHGYGYKTLYAYLNDLMVRTGSGVKRGDIIGTVGNSGLSVAPHLHYEVHLNGKPVNPVNYFFLELTPEQYDQMIMISINSGQSFD
ncbi:MAG TPA: M23 family metallopeptidase [Bacteroidaceae bacterium]|nr:M23 family metallopeptidase [Bacteroidaceae bacterium]